MNDDACEGVPEPGGDPAGTNGAAPKGREGEFAVRTGGDATSTESSAATTEGRTATTGGSAPMTDGGPESSDGGTDPADGSATRTDGGVATRSDRAEYLEAEVNIFDPSTPFMRDHLRIVWTGFALWAVIVFGPVTLTALFPDLMTTQIPVIEFPLHYFLVAIGAPGGAFLLSVWYARKRDALDAEYGIDHDAVAERQGGGPGEPGGVAGGESTGGEPTSGASRTERRPDGGEDR